MSDSTVPTKRKRPIINLIRLGLLLFAAFLILRALQADDTRPLKPLRQSDAQVIFVEDDGQPLLFGFRTLNDDPFAMQDKRLRMSGSYVRVNAPDCPRLKGPGIRWALVDEDLQLNATGFEALLNNLPVGTTLTVDGVWRLYEGPVGCGKSPPEQSLWYLEVDRIVQPNPLFGLQRVDVLPASDGEGTSAVGEAATPTAAGDQPPGGTNRQTVTPSAGSTHSPTPPLTGTVASASPAGALFTSTPPVAGDVTGTAAPFLTHTPPASASPTMSPPAGQPTLPGATATGSTPAAGTLTSTPFPTIPPLQTATPGDGYPGPVNTIVPTSTPDPYD